MPNTRWKSVDELRPSIKVPPGYALGQLTESKVDFLVAELAKWYPEMSVSSEACHLDARFYRTRTYLADFPDTSDRPLFPLLLLNREEGKDPESEAEIVFYFSIQMEPNSRTITARLLVINPRYRGHGIGNLAPHIVEEMGRLAGSELVYYYAALTSVHIQRLAEQSGYQLVGIIPASDRLKLADGSTKRVFEAVYAKVLVEKEQCQFPADAMMTAKTKRLMEFLFS